MDNTPIDASPLFDDVVIDDAMQARTASSRAIDAAYLAGLRHGSANPLVPGVDFFDQLVSGTEEYFGQEPLADVDDTTPKSTDPGH